MTVLFWNQKETFWNQKEMQEKNSFRFSNEKNTSASLHVWNYTSRHAIKSTCLFCNKEDHASFKIVKLWPIAKQGNYCKDFLFVWKVGMSQKFALVVLNLLNVPWDNICFFPEAIVGMRSVKNVYRRFPVNFVKISKRPFFIEHFWWLLLSFWIPTKNTRKSTTHW